MSFINFFFSTQYQRIVVIHKIVLPFCRTKYCDNIFISVELEEILLTLGGTIIAITATIALLVFFARYDDSL